MEFQIRTASQDDFEGIAAVFAEDNRYHAQILPGIFQIAEPIMTREWLQKVLDTPTRTLIVADSQGQIAGVVLANLYHSPDDPIYRPRRYGYVAELGVAEGFQRQGIGRLLMAGASAWAMARGAGEIELNVWEENEEAVTFYERLGYETVRRTMRLKLT